MTGRGEMRMEVQMTNQEKKAYLLKYRDADREINDLLLEKEKTMARLTKITATISDMPKGGGDTDKMTSGVDKLISLDKEIDAKVDALVDFRREIVRYISKLDSDNQKRVLRLRYVDGMKWDRIAVEMGYEIRQITRIHGYALANLNLE